MESICLIFFFGNQQATSPRRHRSGSLANKPSSREEGGGRAISASPTPPFRRRRNSRGARILRLHGRIHIPHGRIWFPQAIPPPSAGSGVPRRASEPGARSSPNPSSRDRICRLHGRIWFSLTGSSRPEGGSTTPKSGPSWCAWLRPHLLKRRDPTARSTAWAFHRVDGRLGSARKSHHGDGGER